MAAKQKQGDGMDVKNNSYECLAKIMPKHPYWLQDPTNVLFLARVGDQAYGLAHEDSIERYLAVILPPIGEEYGTGCSNLAETPEVSIYNINLFLQKVMSEQPHPTEEALFVSPKDRCFLSDLFPLEEIQKSVLSQRLVHSMREHAHFMYEVVTQAQGMDSKRQRELVASIFRLLQRAIHLAQTGSYQVRVNSRLRALLMKNSQEDMPLDLLQSAYEHDNQALDAALEKSLLPKDPQFDVLFRIHYSIMRGFAFQEA